MADPKFSKLASLIRGLTNTASLGFDDEAVGGMRSLYQAATDPNKHISDIPDMYSQARDKFRADSDAAKQQNPGSYMGGQGAGLAASMLMPGSALKAPSALSAALSGAAYGGAAGLGNSTDPSLAGMAKDTAVGAGIGAVAAPIAQKASSMAFPQLRGQVQVPGTQAKGMSDLAGALEESVAGLKNAPGDMADAASRISNRSAEALEKNTANQQAMQGAQDVFRQKVMQSAGNDPDKTAVINDNTQSILKALRNLK